MLADLPDALTSKRNHALIAMGFGGAFRRSELVALKIADLAFEPEDMRVHIRQSKTDQEGRGQEIAIARGTKARPVNAVQDWMRAAKIKGPNVQYRCLVVQT